MLRTLILNWLLTPAQRALLSPPSNENCPGCAAALRAPGDSDCWLWSQEGGRRGQGSGTYVSATTGDAPYIVLAVQSYHGQRPYAPTGLEPFEARVVAERLIRAADEVERSRRVRNQGGRR